jgi:hypothetical protein
MFAISNYLEKTLPITNKKGKQNRKAIIETNETEAIYLDNYQATQLSCVDALRP